MFQTIKFIVVRKKFTLFLLYVFMYMKRAYSCINEIALFLSLLFIFSGSTSVSAQLSPQSEVSILTIGPGDELYSTFGHSALLIQDPELSIRNVYNYGTFSFDDDFYMKFAKGQLDYMLSVSPFENEYYGWTTIENRDVTKQVLNLSMEEKNQLYKFLENNALPQNCVYRYDYFYDNCSNRLDKAIKGVLGNRVRFFPAEVSKEHNRSGASIRQLTHDYLQQMKWGELGIETCLGIEMDRKIKDEQFMFIPDYLMWNYDKAMVRTKDGQNIPLVKEKISLYVRNQQLATTSGEPYAPAVVFGVIFILTLLVSLPSIHNTFFANLFDFLLFFSCGLVGLLLVFLWFFTVHYSQVNFNLLWANPVFFFLSFFYFSKTVKRKLTKYHLVIGLLLLLTLVFWTVLPQHLNNAYLFICMALCLRSFTHYRYFKKHTTNNNSKAERII